jgi:hypothetical protein
LVLSLLTNAVYIVNLITKVYDNESGKVLLTERKRARNYPNYCLQIQLIFYGPLTPSNAVLGENICSQFGITRNAQIYGYSVSKMQLFSALAHVAT